MFCSRACEHHERLDFPDPHGLTPRFMSLATPRGAVFDNTFETAKGPLQAGTSFALALEGIPVLLVTCQHLFGPAGGLSSRRRGRLDHGVRTAPSSTRRRRPGAPSARPSRAPCPRRRPAPPRPPRRRAPRPIR